MTVEDPTSREHPVRRAIASRRRFLTTAGITVGALALAACSNDKPKSQASAAPAAPSGSPTTQGADTTGSATEPLPTPATLKESPLLTAQVKAGTLPPLEKRLPEHPYVVPHKWLTPGTYGGQLTIIIAGTSGGDAAPAAEYFYGYSLLRYLNDGADIGPGLVEKWSTNPDATEWTFHFRKGLRWSDGHPWTTDDIMFWWKNMANDDDFAGESVPDECKSADGLPAVLTAVDATTLRIMFTGPAPMTADRLATWTNGYGGNGASWMAPSYFAKQYHPAFTKGLSNNWAAAGGLFETKVSYRVNPDAPTMAGFRLTQYVEGRSLTWGRNPYYYAVAPSGDQLPYLDGIVMNAVSDPQVTKLKIATGTVDFSSGGLNGLSLSDVSALTKASDRAGTEIYLWGSGSGVGSGCALSQDYYEAKYRTLIRKPKFRQALSLAFNRTEARKAIFFNLGELTTGTMSPRAIELSGSAAGQTVYADWQNSWKGYDPSRAKSLLDDLGLKDTNGDGFREFPDGSKLVLSLDYAAGSSDDHLQKNAQLVRDWKAVGIQARQNPAAPATVGFEYQIGKLMSRTTINVPDAPALMSYPQWLVPIDTNQWAPLQGAMYSVRGTKAETSELNVDPYKRHPPRMAPEKGGAVAKLWQLYDKARVEPDAVKRAGMVWTMVKLHITDGPYFIGVVANAPVVFVVKRDLKNVPTTKQLAHGGYTLPWVHPTPAVYDPETFYWTKPEEH